MSDAVTIRVRLPPRTYARLRALKDRMDAASYNEVVRQAIREMDERTAPQNVADCRQIIGK